MHRDARRLACDTNGAGDGVNGIKAVGDAFEGGSGWTLVLLNGLGGTWHIWKPVLPLLEKPHRVIAPTLPGHPGGPPIPAGVETTVDVLADLLPYFGFIRHALNEQGMEHGDRVPPDESRRAMHSMRDTTMLPALLVSMGKVGGIAPFKADPPLVRIAGCELDKVMPYARGQTLTHSVVVGAEGLFVKGCGHVPMYDDPEQVASLILATTARVDEVAA